MSYRVFLILFLGMFFGFGPFLTDMYLPAFPQLQRYFNTNASMVQTSLFSCMLGLALGQVIWGPLSDRYGRKIITHISLWIFMLSCVGCLLAPTVETLIAMRLLQGMGGSGGLVLSRSIATDLYTGKELARLMALIGAAGGIAPVTAPIAGGIITDTMGWRGIFGLLLLIGILLAICTFQFKESHPAEKRSGESITKSLTAYKGMLKNPAFTWSVLQYGALHSIFFAYLASSPFIIQEHYGFSATQYSIFFAVNATTVGIASGLSMKFKTPQGCTRTASMALTVLSIIAALTLFCKGSVWMYEACSLLMVFCCGLCFASTPAVALDAERQNAGVAAAVLGVGTYVFGGMVTPLVGMADTRVCTGFIYIISSILTLYCSQRMYYSITRKSSFPQQ